jgi:hypothetical protein
MTKERAAIRANPHESIDRSHCVPDDEAPFRQPHASAKYPVIHRRLENGFVIRFLQKRIGICVPPSKIR